MRVRRGDLHCLTNLVVCSAWIAPRLRWREPPGDHCMISILFVDDDPNVGAGLKRTLRGMRDAWTTRFALDGHEALEMLAREPADVIVTDMRMPGMDGAELLAEVEKRSPETVRIILSGQCDRQSALSAVGPTHIFLSKPCDSEQLVRVIRRVHRLGSLLAKPKLAKAIAGLRSLPSPSETYLKLVAALDEPECSVPAVAEIIGRDMALTAKLLQLVNSAFFGAHWHASTVLQAVHLLGTELVKTLVLTFGILQRMSDSLPAAGQLQCWKHGVQAAAGAHFIARDLALDKRAVEEAFTAGLLHDIGLLLLATLFREAEHSITRLCVQERASRCAVERRILGVTHAEIGGYLLAL
ncbi:MAG TPA: HDOD domain-containing protein, partial [Stellaceae bacterium]|nr:HDOD domain-containing protein [Stellaceae bacterium]